MESFFLEYAIQHAPEWVPAIGALFLLWRISRVLCKALPDIIEKMTQIRELHRQTAAEMREFKIAHNELHERVGWIESNCTKCTQNRRAITDIRGGHD